MERQSEIWREEIPPKLSKESQRHKTILLNLFEEGNQEEIVEFIRYNADSNLSRDQEVKEAVENLLLDLIRKRDTMRIDYLRRGFFFSPRFLQSQDVKSGLNEWYNSILESNKPINGLISSNLPLPPEITTEDEFQKRFSQMVIDDMDSSFEDRGYWSDFKSGYGSTEWLLKKGFLTKEGLSQVNLKRALKTYFIDVLNSKDPDAIKEYLIETLKILPRNKEFLSELSGCAEALIWQLMDQRDKKGIETVKSIFSGVISEKDFELITAKKRILMEQDEEWHGDFCQSFEISDETLKEAAFLKLCNHIVFGEDEKASRMAKQYKLQDDFFTSETRQKKLREALKSNFIMDGFNFKNWIKIKERFGVDFGLKHEKLLFSYFSPEEVKELLSNEKLLEESGFNNPDLSEKEIFEKFFREFAEAKQNWSISDIEVFRLLAYGEGIKIEGVEWEGLGVETIFHYLGQKNRSDVLHVIWSKESLGKLLEIEETKRGKRIKNTEIVKGILLQTAKDQSIDYSGNDSYQALGIALRNFLPEWLHPTYFSEGEERIPNEKVVEFQNVSAEEQKKLLELHAEEFSKQEFAIPEGVKTKEDFRRFIEEKLNLQIADEVDYTNEVDQVNLINLFTTEIKPGGKSIYYEYWPGDSIYKVKEVVFAQVEEFTDKFFEYPMLNELKPLPGFIESGYFTNVKVFRKEVEKRRKITPEIKKTLEKLEKNDPLFHAYLTKLINHPTVDFNAVLEFAKNPEVFFSRGDSHAPADLQAALSPETITALGDEKHSIALTSENLRDALIKGQIDQLSPFTPFARDYEFFVKNKEAVQLEMRIKQLVDETQNDVLALFRREDLNDKEKKFLNENFKLFQFIFGLDQNSLLAYSKENSGSLLSGKKIPESERKKIEEKLLAAGITDLEEIYQKILQFKEIDPNFLLKKGKVSLKEGLTALPTITTLDNLAEGKEYLREMLVSGFQKMAKQYTGEKIIIRAEVLEKKDPRFATIGDDTACCMFFGSGKENVYLMYPHVGALTLSFRGEGEKPEEGRIAAQSILTPDLDLGAAFTFSKEKVKAMMNQGLLQTLGEGFLEKFYFGELKKTLVCDNVEGQKNYIEKLILNDQTIIPTVYRQFFEEYRRQNQEFTNAAVVIGQSNSDYCTGLNTIQNSFLPEALISYSDNAQESSLELLAGKSGEKKQEKRRRAASLKISDTLPVAFLEEKVYGGENPDLIEGLGVMQKIVYASKLLALRESVAETSLGFFDDEGVLRGYLLSYLGQERAKPKDKAEKKIYVHDLAVETKFRKSPAAGYLLREFLERVSGDEKLKGMPIVARCREKTSYQLIKNSAKKYGYEIVTDAETHAGGEIFHMLELRKI